MGEVWTSGRLAVVWGRPGMSRDQVLGASDLLLGGTWGGEGAALGAGDGEGDGRADLALLAPEQGTLAWLRGPGFEAAEGALDEVAGLRLTGEGRFGAAWAFGIDLDRDGYGELFVAAPSASATVEEAGAVLVFMGP